jgi:hypothetical protein
MPALCHVPSVVHQTYQQIAVLGMVVTILGFNPRKNPRQPSRCRMTAAAWNNPRTFRNSLSVAVPLVCSNVFITSSGVVMPAAIPPATPPAKQCVYGSYDPFWLRTFDMLSYAVNCIAVNGTVMQRVVGYET